MSADRTEKTVTLRLSPSLCQRCGERSLDLVSVLQSDRVSETGVWPLVLIMRCWNCKAAYRLGLQGEIARSRKVENYWLWLKEDSRVLYLDENWEREILLRGA